MLKPYRPIEETDRYVVYEFRTFYLYVLYGILGIIAVGYFANISVLTIGGMVLMVLYFLLVSTQYLNVNEKIKRAAKTSSIEMSGSKWSLTKPLRVKIKKESI